MKQNIYFPIIKKIHPELLSDSIISMSPGETWEHAVQRYKIEQRIKKINKIKKGS